MPPRQTDRSDSKKERLRAARAHAERREHFTPVRQVIVRSPVRILRELASVKMRSMVPCELAIEYDHYVVLDVRRDVLAFHAQPEVLHYEDQDGTPRWHVPDVRVYLACGDVEFHEVKQDKRADDLVTRRLHSAIAAEYKRRGARYLVMKESEVRRQPRLTNAELLRSVRSRRPDRKLVDQVHSALANGALTLGELQALVARGAEGKADLLALALHGLLDVDWEHIPIGPDMPVLLPRKAGERP